MILLAVAVDENESVPTKPWTAHAVNVRMLVTPRCRRRSAGLVVLTQSLSAHDRTDRLFWTPTRRRTGLHHAETKQARPVTEFVKDYMRLIRRHCPSSIRMR